MEELVCEGYLIIGANLYREITTLHVSGKAIVNKEKILCCSRLAIERIKETTELLKKVLEEDKKLRLKEDADIIGFTSLIKGGDNVLCGHLKQTKTVQIEEEEEFVPEEMDVVEMASNTKAYRFDPNTVGIGEGGPSRWEFDENVELPEDEDEDVIEHFNRTTREELLKMKFRDSNVSASTLDATIELESSDDEVIILDPEKIK